MSLTDFVKQVTGFEHYINAHVIMRSPWSVVALFLEHNREEFATGHFKDVLFYKVICSFFLPFPLISLSYSGIIFILKS